MKEEKKFNNSYGISKLTKWYMQVCSMKNLYKIDAFNLMVLTLTPEFIFSVKGL